MRLDAAWGLEPNAEPVETYKANLPERMKRGGASGVQYDTKLQLN